ncbi:hypothetical protein ACF0H5_001575 [Mactra antiquata]
MWGPAIVIALVGFFCICDAVPYFEEEGMNALIDRLSKVREDWDPAEQLGMLVCRDTDPANRIVKIELVEDSNFIKITPFGYGRVKVQVINEGSIDFELTVDQENQQNNKKETFQCTNDNPEDLPTKFDAAIVITDVNDNAPKFIRDTAYSAFIDEIITQSIPYKIHPPPDNQQEIIVTDADGVDNNVVTAECVGMQRRITDSQKYPCDGYFSVTAVKTSGEDGKYVFEVFALSQNYTDSTSYSLEIRAKNIPNDPNEPTLESNSHNLIINVRDIQNKPPFIDTNALSFQMYEDLTPNMELDPTKLVGAFDQDARDPNPIRFELFASSVDPYAFDNNLFYLKPQETVEKPEKWYRAHLFLNNSVDREQIDNLAKKLYLGIRAIEYPENPNSTDRNPMQAEATISIDVLDVNDEQPRFLNQPYNFQVTELSFITNQEADYQISSNQFEISVEDKDSSLFNSFDVSIVSGNEDGYFRLNRANGSQEEAFILYVKEKILDYEVLPNSYILTLRAVDSDFTGFTSEAIVTLTIKDANDNSPEFDKSVESIFILEDAAVGTQVGRVVATDLDDGAFGEIAFYEVRDDSDTFNVSNDGRIFLQKPLDYESKKSYFFTVTAWDGVEGDRNDGSILVSVAVQNVIDVGPVFETNYEATLAEESFELIPEIVISATSQENISTSLAYFIVSVEPSTVPFNAFSVDRISGRVSVNQFINFNQSTNGAVQVTFRATAGSISSTTTALITIKDLNNYAPEFIPTDRYNTSVVELSKGGDVVIALTAIDRDGPGTDNGEIYFQILSGANDEFIITRDTGIILVSGNAALDVDGGQTVFELVISVRDKGNPVKSATAIVTIKIEDSNNKDPFFLLPLYTFQINEDDPIDTQVGFVEGDDLDSDSILSYSIDQSSAEFQKAGTAIREFVDINDVLRMDETRGLITVSGFMDRTVYDRITFMAVVEDVNIDYATQPRQTATASCVVFIRAALDVRIYFAPPWTRENPVIQKTFSETENDFYQILPLTATDPVVPETVTNYRKVISSDPDDYFLIDGRLLYIQKPLDYEALPGNYVKKVSVVIEAISSDQERTGTATVEVYVQDLNDNAPVFERSSYTFNVSEDKSFTSLVGKVKATDVDSSSYGEVEYFLTGSNHEDFFVYTDRSAGDYEAVIVVSESAKLDFETISRYNLILYAQDNPGNENNNNVRFSSTVDIEINVQDVNDMIPEFSEVLYEMSAIGTQEPGTDVGFVDAVDGDAGVNGEIEYSIYNSTNEGLAFFGIETIDEQSAEIGKVLKIGRIFVRRSLKNLADRSLFEMIVYARDKGTPRLAPGVCRVKIIVSKGVQDLKPKWDERLLSRVQIPENQPINTLVYNVLAYPAGAEASIIYSFVGAGDTFRDYESFNIDSNTGEITTDVVLDYEAKRSFNLLILATDSLNSTLTNQFLLTVQVMDVDDNIPSFLDCPDISYNIPETATVYEEQNPGKFVFRARACDRDQPPLNKVRYSWYLDTEYCVFENMQHFELDNSTGVVTTRVKLDRERRDEYLLCVEAFPDVDKRKKRDLTSDLKSRNNHKTVLYILVRVLDVNDLGPRFSEPSVKKVILKYPAADVSVAEAYDDDLPPNNDIRYSIDSIRFVIDGKTQNAPTAFTVNGKDGTISIGTNDYSDYVGGYFDITVRADDYNGANVESDTQLQRVYVTDRTSRIRVVIDKPADDGIDRDAKQMIRRLNELSDDVYYEIKTISFHVTSNSADPRFDKTDICMVVVSKNDVLSSVSASKQLTDNTQVKNILEDYGAVDPGPCDPASSVYPVGWESYWWVLVAFALFIFVCCIILIFIICVLYRQYKQYMESRRTYLVPGN